MLQHANAPRLSAIALVAVLGAAACNGGGGDGDGGTGPTGPGRFVDLSPTSTWGPIKGVVLDAEDRPVVLADETCNAAGRPCTALQHWTGTEWRRDLLVPSSSYGGAVEGLNGGLTVDADGAPLVFFLGQDGKQNAYGRMGSRIYFNALEPKDTWSAPVTPFPQGAASYVAASVDRGLVFYFLVEDRQGALHFARYDRAWVNWTDLPAPEVVAGSARNARLAIGNGGALFAAYQDESAGGRVRLVQPAAQAGATATDLGLMSPGAADLVSIVLDPLYPANDPMVAYRDPTDGSAHLATPDGSGGFNEWQYGNKPLDGSGVTALVAGRTEDGPIVGYVDAAHGGQLRVAVWDKYGMNWTYLTAPGAAAGPVTVDPRGETFIYRDADDPQQRCRVMARDTVWHDLGYPIDQPCVAAAYDKLSGQGSPPTVALIYDDAGTLRVTVLEAPTAGTWARIADLPEPAATAAVSLHLCNPGYEDATRALSVGYISAHDGGDGPVARLYPWSLNAWFPQRWFDFDEYTWSPVLPSGVYRPGQPPLFLLSSPIGPVTPYNLHVGRGEDDGTITDLGIFNDGTGLTGALAATATGQLLVAYHVQESSGVTTHVKQRALAGSTWDEIGAFTGTLEGLLATSQGEPLLLVGVGDASNYTRALETKRFDGSRWTDLGTPRISEGMFGGVYGAALDRRDRLFLLFKFMPDAFTYGVDASRLSGTTWEEPASYFGNLRPADGMHITLGGIVFTSADEAVVASTYRVGFAGGGSYSQPLLSKFVHD